MATYRVENVPDGERDTSETYPECGYWIDHWMTQVDFFEPLMCANTKCDKEAELGGHVYVGDDDETMYIIPICQPCNELPAAYISRHEPIPADHWVCRFTQIRRASKAGAGTSHKQQAY